MSLEETIREIARDEYSKLQQEGHANLMPAEEFCDKKEISYVTLWRAEKRGEIKLTRIGKRVFINTNQFAAA